MPNATPAGRDNTRPPLGKKAIPAPANRWRNNRFIAVEPATVRQAITEVERGELERWADMADFMLREDGWLRANYETRALAITGAELEVTPGRGRPGTEALAEEAADFWREEWEQARDVESVLTTLIHAEGVGWAVCQHDWQPDGGVWRSAPSRIAPRDFEFSPTWGHRVRTYTDDKGQPTATGRWLDIGPEDADSFIFHIPSKLHDANLGGDLMALVWTWLFKRWALTYQQEVLEKHAGPFVLGKVDDNAADTAVDELKADLERFTQSQVGVFRGSTDVQFKETVQRAGEAWQEAINGYHLQYSVGLLGSDLNTAVGSTGGNRSLGESQFSTAILPRLVAIAKRVCGTVEGQWAATSLRFNAHLFGGRIAPTPQLRLRLINDEQKPIPSDAINAGMRVKQDEMRGGYSLEALGKEDGGDDIVVPLPPAAMPFGAPPVTPPPASGGAAPARPFARTPKQLGWPWRTSPTSSISETRIDRLRFDASDDPGNSR